MKHLGILITFLLLCVKAYPILNVEIREASQDPYYASSTDFLAEADQLFSEHKFKEAIITYHKAKSDPTVPKDVVFKKIALIYAASEDIAKTTDYIEKYLFSNFNTSIFTESGFDSIRQEPDFKALVDKYSPTFNLWSFLYLYVALIGFYIAAILHFNKKIDSVAKVLISCFVFIHSVFILHICLNITNYHFRFPHSYLMSTSFSFLYGPLLYFYFKRITQQYVFKKSDVLHLIPTIVLFIYLLPTYLLSGSDKLNTMLERVSNGYKAQDSSDLILLVTLKLTSLIIYGYFIRKLYIASKKNKSVNNANKLWKRNIYVIHISYIICYSVYGILISYNITSGVVYHSQVICMALMIMYIGYSANVQPSVFSGAFTFGDKLFFKYEKSGLTSSLSVELKDNLIALLEKEKIYKESDINLEVLAERLNTTRHNASQVINEHFDLNFHELINKYRINEAKNIFNLDHQKNLHIIDVVYEVGYNNKVTFNKAFKKDTNLTPSEYQRLAIQASV